MNLEKKFVEMTMANRYMFATLMREPDLCKGVLERILGKNIKETVYVNELKRLEACLSYGGVAVEVKYEDGSLEDVEIMIIHEYETQKRAVNEKLEMDYYVNCLSSGHVPDKRLKLIYLCTYDAFKYNKPRYTITKGLESCVDIDTYQDTIYINLTCSDFSDADEKVADIIRYLQDGRVSNDFFEKINIRIDELKKNEEWRELVLKYLEAEEKFLKDIKE